MKPNLHASLETAAIGVALLLSLVPLGILWASIARPLFPALPLVALVAALAFSAAIVYWLRQLKRELASAALPDRARLGAMLLFFGLVLLLRLLNVRDVVLPLWVDSVHHSAISRLILAQASLPASYRPFADVDLVYYHLGYHTVVAALSWLTGQSVESVMLVFGQVLNALVCFTLYALALRWTAQPVAAFTAALVPATLSLMPAYYVTWGRYTQLDGLVILPVAILAFESALEYGGARKMLLAGILAGGLFLVHYRVSYFFAAYVAAYLIWHSLLAIRGRKSVQPIFYRTIAVTFIALLSVAPWLWRLWTTIAMPFDSFFSRLQGTNEYNAIPWDLITGDLNPWLFAFALLGIALGIWQHRPQVPIVVLWVLLVALFVNPQLLGASPSWLVNNFSLVIALFVPLSLLAGLATAGLLELLARFPDLREHGMELALWLALLLLLAGSIARRVDVINPATVFVASADVSAMQWIREQTAPASVFLVNEGFWQENIYIGTDGGYWIPNLTGRRTTMPIVFYTEGTPQYIEQVNSLARVIESGPDPDSPAFLRDLQARGVTHVYIGVKGGPLPLPKFEHSPHYAELYSHDGVHIFEIRY